MLAGASAEEGKPNMFSDMRQKARELAEKNDADFESSEFLKGLRDKSDANKARWLNADPFDFTEDTSTLRESWSDITAWQVQYLQMQGGCILRYVLPILWLYNKFEEDYLQNNAFQAWCMWVTVLGQTGRSADIEIEHPCMKLSYSNFKFTNCRYKRELQDRYCYRQAELGVGDCGGLQVSSANVASCWRVKLHALASWALTWVCCKWTYLRQTLMPTIRVKSGIWRWKQRFNWLQRTHKWIKFLRTGVWACWLFSCMCNVTDIA